MDKIKDLNFIRTKASGSYMYNYGSIKQIILQNFT